MVDWLVGYSGADCLSGANNVDLTVLLRASLQHAALTATQSAICSKTVSWVLGNTGTGTTHPTVHSQLHS